MHRYRPPDLDGRPPVPIRVHEPPPDKPTYFSQELARLLGPQTIQSCKHGSTGMCPHLPCFHYDLEYTTI